MDLGPIIVLIPIFLSTTNAVRLHKLFEFMVEDNSKRRPLGFLHVGNDYSVLLKTPAPFDKYLVYELYQSKKDESEEDNSNSRAHVIAISKIPIEYLKDALKTFREELIQAKYLNGDAIPGTRVLTVREWQLRKAMELKDKDGLTLKDKAPILRTKV